MMKTPEELIDKLTEKIFTTTALKDISDTLEELSLDKRFKLHANAIASDDTLTDGQKKRQLSYLLKVIDNPTLYDFFSDEVLDKNSWLFTAERIDYFDKFVQQFQMATEEMGVIFLVTAIQLEPTDLKQISQDLSKAFGYKAIIKPEVNPELIGGAQVRVENMIFDYSLRTKFTQFRKTWLNSLTKTEKLIGRNQT